MKISDFPVSTRDVDFIGSARDDLSDMPDEVKQTVGFAISQAQLGEKHPDAKPLKGFGGAGVLEVVENFDGDTYRAVYTVKFKQMIYVLHCFKKKSAKGAQTNLYDVNLIKTRLKEAERRYKEAFETQKTG